MGIFDQSTPVDFTPEQDTVEETAELENTEEYEQYEEQEQDYTEEQEATDPDPGHSEELIAGKFKSQDDLVKAYKGLERKLHERSQQPPAQPQYQQPQQYDEDPNDAILQALNRDPIGTLNYFVQQGVKQALAPIQEERTTERLATNINTVAQEYRQMHSEEGMDALFNKIGELAQELGNPNLVQNPSPRILRMAAEELWGKQSVAQVYQQALQQGRQQAEASRRAKVGLNAPGTTKPKQVAKSPEDLIAESIVSAGRRGGLFG